MAIYSPRNLGLLWEQAGGSAKSRTVAVAIALAESGGRTNAISPSSDYGLWQINKIHFGHTGGCGLDWSNWDQPLVNACAAVRIANAGENFAAWCTMWADPVRDCGHGFIQRPQYGSATYAQMDRARSGGGGGGGGTAPGPPPLEVIPGLDLLVRRVEWANGAHMGPIPTNIGRIKYNTHTHPS